MWVQQTSLERSHVRRRGWEEHGGRGGGGGGGGATPMAYALGLGVRGGGGGPPEARRQECDGGGGAREGGQGWQSGCGTRFGWML